MAPHKLFADQNKWEGDNGLFGAHDFATWVIVDMDKIYKVGWDIPKILKRTSMILGLTGYYWKFIKHYAQIAEPLTKQLRQDSFGWTEKAITTFSQLKEAMTPPVLAMTPPVLAMPDFHKPSWLRQMLRLMEYEPC